MQKAQWPLILIAVTAAFLFVNRASYGGYFYGDDLNTLSWAIHGNVREYLYWLVTPLYNPAHFRPVGAFYYRILGGTWGLNYPPYVAVLQIIHLCNVVLLFLVIRRLKLPLLGCMAGALIFLFHVATVDVYWKPMYVFDLLCGTFCLLTFLLYMRGNWILAVFAFWLAIKSKEVVVLLPVLLAAYELLFAKRYWKPLIPFFAISMIFGVQGLLPNISTDNAYTFRFTVGGLAKSTSFYATELVFNPYVCIFALIAATRIRDRRFHFGLMTAIVLLAPMLLLPQRLYSAYWYVPMVGVSMMVAALSPTPRWLLIGAASLWILGNYALFRPKQNEMLEAGRDNRVYMDTFSDFARRNPGISIFGFDGLPREMYPWGVEGAAQILYQVIPRVFLAPSPEFEEARKGSPACLLRWRPESHSLEVSLLPGL